VILKTLLAYIIAISAIVLMYSLSMPTYTNDTYKQALDDRGMKAMANNQFEQFKDYYYHRLDEIRTSKPQIMDISFGILVASVTLYCFMLSTRIRKYHSFKYVTTFKKGDLLLVSNLMWLLLIPGVYWHYLFRSGRGDYPWFADDISIPLGSKLPYLFVGWVLLNIFILVFSYKSKFPAHLFGKRPPVFKQGIFWNAFFGTLIVLNTIFLGWLINDGDQVSIIVNLYLTHLLLSLRAGKIHAYKLTLKQNELNTDEQTEIDAQPATK
jgi:hypothetical protein